MDLSDDMYMALDDWVGNKIQRAMEQIRIDESMYIHEMLWGVSVGPVKAMCTQSHLERFEEFNAYFPGIEKYFNERREVLSRARDDFVDKEASRRR